jgi:hypothetical protein
LSAIKLIKQELIDKVSAVSSVNKVYNFEKKNPDGFPAVFITFSGTENQFYTNAENERVYIYRCLILCQIGQSDPANASADEVEAAEVQIEDITQDIMDAIDADYTLGDNVQILFVDAAVGEPGYVQYEGGWARSSEVIIRVHSMFLV